MASSVNVGPRGSKHIVHLSFPPLARRHEGRVIGRIGEVTRRAGITVHGAHHSTVRGLGTLGGNNAVARSSRTGNRGGVRGLASGCYGRVSDITIVGRGRVLRVWFLSTISGGKPLFERDLGKEITFGYQGLAGATFYHDVSRSW